MSRWLIMKHAEYVPYVWIKGNDIFWARSPDSSSKDYCNVVPVKIVMGRRSRNECFMIWSMLALSLSLLSSRMSFGERDATRRHCQEYLESQPQPPATILSKEQASCILCFVTNIHYPSHAFWAIQRMSSWFIAWAWLALVWYAIIAAIW